jgi:fatty-acyl-CoA synthase
MLYTGGTTGMPKGVMYRHGDFSGRLYDAYAMLSVAPPPQRATEIPAFVEAMVAAAPTTSVPCCPLMHGTGMWISAMRAHLVGGTVVLLESRHFDAHELWDAVERERVTEIVIVGDAFARPILRALEEREAEGTPYDTSSVAWIVSSGTIWSSELKDGLRARTPAVLLDLLGSTEAGTIGSSIAAAGSGAETAKFSLASGARVVTEDDRRDVVAGSGERGMLATQSVAYGYWNDPEKSARTFVEIDGASYVISGDWAMVEADGSITLLGRGSNCINTGGEKVFPEEVEEAIKRHPDIDDCMVVGLPDERFGQRVAAVASASSGASPSEEELRSWLRSRISHYKIPSSIVVLDTIRRAPNGKADYDWARRTASASVNEG